MRETKIERTARFFDSMSKLGFSYSEAQSLRRIEMTLQRWAERECGDENGCICRDDETNKPYWLNATTSRRYPVPDREAGALKRLAKIMAGHPDLWSYHQGDCRGCMLYIGRKSDLRGTPGVREDFRTGQFVPTVNGCDVSPTSFDKERALQIAKEQKLSLDSHYTRGFAVCI